MLTPIYERQQLASSLPAEHWAVRGMLLWQHRRLLARVTVIAFVLSIGLALIIPKRYRSSASIMPPDQQSSGTMMLAALASRTGSLGGLGNLAGSLLGAHTTTALFVDLLHSGTVSGHLIDRFALQHLYRKRYRVDAAKRLARRTTITEDKKAGVITVEVEDEDPTRARDLVEAYLDELNKLVLETNTSAAHRERIFIERRLQAVSADLEKAQIALSEFSSIHSTVDIKEQTHAMVDAGARIEAELLLQQSGLQSLRQIYGDSNVRVRETEARIASLQRDMKNMTGTSAPLGAQPEAATAGELYPPLRQLPRLAVPYADLYRKVRVQETVYELLTQQYEMARIEEEKDVPLVSVIDAPGIPEKKSFPARLLLTLALTFAAFAGCSALLLTREHWSRVAPDDPGKALVTEVFCALRLKRSGS